MTEPMANDEEMVQERIREAFPVDEGMPAESTWRLHAQLRPVATGGARQRRMYVSFGVTIAAALVVAAGAFGVYAAQQNRMPEPTLADRIEARYPAGVPTAPKQSSAVPALALRAINPSGKVLHFTSKGETAFGPHAGESTEEMWYDPTTGAGRLVLVEGAGKDAVTTTLVSDGSAASVTTEKPGESPVTEIADMSGRLGKSFDKLSAYRKMLESGTATVTAEGTSQGAKTYKLRAEVDGFGGEFLMVMEAEVRADNYLPISFQSGLQDASGETTRLRTREFSTFDTVNTGDLPGGWFTPSGSKAPGTSTPGVWDL